MVLIKNVKIIPGLNGWLLIDFDDGKRKLVNINPHMEGVLEKLSDHLFFSKVFVDKELGTVSWPGELDLDPDNLYRYGIDMELVSSFVNKVTDEEAFVEFIDRETV